jgi:hypothetical protein
VAASMPRLLLVMALTLLVAAPAAMADTRSDIIVDCYDDGDLDGNYSPSEIRDARNNLPADIDQYSDCRDVLARAVGGSGDKQIGGGGGGGDALGGGGGGGGGGPSEPLAPSGPEEQAALAQAAASGGDAAVQVGDRTVVPGSVSAVRNPVPITVLVALILLGACALAGAVPPIRRRVLARRLA